MIMPTGWYGKITVKYNNVGSDYYQVILISNEHYNGCIRKTLIKNHHDWLNEEFKVPNIREDQQIPSKEPVPGRPKQDFGVSSLRSKQRSVQSLVQNISPEKLSFATESSLFRKRKAAKMMKLALETSPRSFKTNAAVKK
ncbi:unnamed protein product [Euphydryas editha]|uniref:Uncharacterized protein n=1 Tax=Euphydryas editha TaxID=104508 RepID=A0AAU9U9S4_EUPED|nr:unnamed protein product [Euphydryas editha]